MSVKLPKLPPDVFSLLGPVPLLPLDSVRAEAEDLYGRFLPGTRLIEIADGMPPASEWATLWHEVLHLALLDAGAGRKNVLSETQEEIICDAVATYLTAAMQAGYLKVTRPTRHDSDAP